MPPPLSSCSWRMAHSVTLLFSVDVSSSSSCFFSRFVSCYCMIWEWWRMLSHSAWPHRLSPSSQNQQQPLTTVATSELVHAQSEESGIEPGHIATITGSLASLPEEHDHYDTDHTDLGSETDEVELRRELLRDVSGGNICCYVSDHIQWIFPKSFWNLLSFISFEKNVLFYVVDTYNFTENLDKLSKFLSSPNHM